MIEVLKQSAEDVSKVYDILAFGHTERALEILAKTRTSLRQAIAELESQEPASDYERGVIDGMQKQAQSSVDKAVNAMAQRTWVGLTDEDKKQMAKEANYHWEMTAGEYAERIGQLTEAKLKERNNA